MFIIIFIILAINTFQVNSDNSSAKDDFNINVTNTKQSDNGTVERYKKQLSFNELEIEKFNPCADGFITMERYVGLPYEEENYYNATAYLGQYKKFIPYADIDIALDNPATISVDPKIARVSVGTNREFHIRTYELPPTFNFTVKTAAFRPFPNLARVELSTKLVCENPKKWTPKLLGPSLDIDDFGARVFVPDDEQLNRSCGRRQLDGVALVTSSEDTNAGDWPWHVAIYHRNNIQIKKYRCGGTIISASAILTAAHCGVELARPIPPSTLTVFVGKYRLNIEEIHSKEYQVLKVIIHNRFSPRNLKNDIALLKLSENIIYSDYVQPICLWNFKQLSKNYLFGELGTLVGWGSIKLNASISDKLRTGTMKLVSDTTCLLSYSDFYQTFLTEDTFCAGTGGPNGTSACNGDSGGALTFNVTGVDGVPTWYLRGIVSISVSLNGTCNPNHYTVFTDSVQYMSWIYSNWT